MKQILAWMMAVMVGAACAARAEDTNKAAAGKSGDKAAVYSCEKCNMDAKAAGKCPMDGTELKKGHLMKGADGKKYVCPCPADCTCGMKEGNTATCSCGKPAREVNWMDKKAAEKKAGDKAPTP